VANEDKIVRPAREVVGVYNNPDALEAAAAELLASGFERAQITLLAGENAVVEKLGHKYERVEELEDNPDTLRITYRSKESFDAAKSALLGSLVSIGAVATAGAIFASGGALAATLGSGVIGAEVGAFIGGVVGDIVDNHRANYLRNQLDHGGLLLFVQATNDAEEDTAKQILSKHSGRDVHAHSIPATAGIP
jgi:hypothetical protein